MHKIKLILLNVIFLIPSLNGILIKFPDKDKPVNIDDKYGEIFIPLKEIDEYNREHKYLAIDILENDFEKIKEILLKARILDLQIHQNAITQDLKEKQIAELIILFRNRGNEFIRTLARANERLRIKVLNETIEDISNEIKNDIKIQIDSSITLTDGAILERDSEFTITPQMSNLSKALKIMLNVSESEQTIKLPNIDIHTMNLLLPIWRLTSESLNTEATSEAINKTKQQLNTTLKHLTFQQLDLLLNAVNFLDIQPLFNLLISEISKRILTPEVITQFRLHPERFTNQGDLNLTSPYLSQLIIKNMPSTPLIETLWRTQIEENCRNYSIMQDGRIAFAYWGKPIKILTLNLDGTSSSTELAPETKGNYLVGTTPDGRIVTSVGDTIKVWTINPDGTTSSIEVLKPNTPMYYSRVMPNGSILIGNGTRATRVVTLWRVTPDGKISSIELKDAGTILDIKTMPKDYIVTQNDRVTKIWKIKPDGTLSSIEFEDRQEGSSFCPIGFISDKHILIRDFNDKVKLLTINNDETTSIKAIKPQFNEHPYNNDFFVTDILGIMPNRRVITLSKLSNKYAMNLSQHCGLKTWKIKPDGTASFIKLTKDVDINTIGIISDQQIIAGNSSWGLSIITIKPNNEATSIELNKYINQHLYRIRSIEIMPDNRFITVDDAFNIKIWNNKTIPQQLNLEQILFIKAFKQKALDLKNPIFLRIFNSLDPQIQGELVAQKLIKLIKKNIKKIT